MFGSVDDSESLTSLLPMFWIVSLVPVDILVSEYRSTQVFDGISTGGNELAIRFS